MVDHGSRISRVGLAAKRGLTSASSVLGELAAWLETRGITPVFDIDTARLAGLPEERPYVSREDLPRACDLIVVLGGDGTLIGVAGLVARAGTDVPILGVNYGSLGFLTEIALPELYDALEATLNGAAHMAPRAMLAAETRRGESPFADHIVLNDIVITKGAMSRIVEIAVRVGSEDVTKVRADGLIVASPTGSTAYNLAAGGPIVHPTVDAMVLTPIAPHTLSNRPVVIPASSIVQLRPIMDRGDEVFVTFDGQAGHSLRPGDVVIIRQAPRRVRIVRSPKRSYFELLRTKLKWGAL